MLVSDGTIPVTPIETVNETACPSHGSRLKAQIVMFIDHVQGGQQVLARGQPT